MCRGAYGVLLLGVETWEYGGESPGWVLFDGNHDQDFRLGGWYGPVLTGDESMERLYGWMDVVIHTRHRYVWTDHSVHMYTL